MKSISRVFRNSYSDYYWMLEVHFADNWLSASRTSCFTKQSPTDMYEFESLKFPYGCDEGERCLVPSLECQYCRRYFDVESDYDIAFDRLWSAARSMQRSKEEKYIQLFAELYEKSGHTRHTYKQCGCVISKRDEYNFYLRKINNKWNGCVSESYKNHLEIGMIIQSYATEIDWFSEFEATQRSARRVKKPLKRNELTFFQNINAAAQLTKHLVQL